MADTRKLKVIIEAENRTSRVLDRAESRIERFRKKINAAFERATLPSTVLAGAIAFGSKSVVTASSELESALLGLSRVAEAVGAGQDKAKIAAQELAKDGLMSVKDASEGLKNLLATGFSLPQAIKLMDAFKDSEIGRASCRERV